MSSFYVPSYLLQCLTCSDTYVLTVRIIDWNSIQIVVIISYNNNNKMGQTQVICYMSA